MHLDNRAQITLRIPKEMDDQIFQLAKRNHLTKTEQIRRLIKKSMSQQAYQEDEEKILAHMQAALKSVLDPQIERMVKIAVKNSIASSVNLLYTSMLLYRLCEPKSRPKLEEFMDAARMEGIRFVQMGKGSIEGFLKSAMEKLVAMWDNS